jgi:F0F1-type ATP synthase membrane subunit b/b'
MEFVLGALIFLIFVTQIVWPSFKGRALFPFFRKQQELEKKLADANQARFEAELEKKVAEVQPHSTNKQ